MRVLVVDDVEANVYLLKVLLTNAGYDVIEAANGKIAIDLMQSETVDLVVSDILMPVMDGFELCKIWKSDTRLKNIPFIFYTATYTEQKDREFSLSLGADLFLVKPMESYNLLREIEKILNNNKSKPSVEAVHQPNIEDAAYYEEYSSRLVQKLEAKLLQLEQKNSELRRRDSRLRDLNDTLNFQLAKIQINEAALKAHKNELLSIVHSMEEGVLTTDHKGVIYEFNPAAEEILGYDRQEAVGKPIDMFMPKPSREKHKGFLKNFVKDEGDRLTARDMIAVNKLGEKVPIRLSVGRLPPDDLKRQKFICTFLDISAEKQQQEAILRSRKMEAIGNLSGGIAHDYNNMLGVIVGYGELLLSGTDNAEQRGYTEMILHAAERGASLTRKLLSLSKKGPEASEIININEVITNNVAVLQTMLVEQIELVVELADRVPPILVDKNAFEDCLLNMCINSMHAISNGGRISIKTEPVVLKNNNETNLSAGNYLKVSVEDNGSGMSDEVAKKIFEPFFTTKGEKGTGLGLSQAYNFVKQSKGYLGVDTKEGVGTRFDFYFPETKAHTKAPKAQVDASHQSSTKSHTILLVDDEPVLLRLSERNLTKAGHTVIVANNAAECMEKLSCAKVDLLITDVIMPGMDGFELSATVRERYPDMKVLLMSGYNDEDNKHQLQKPFTKIQLYDAIERIFQNDKLR